MATSLNIRVSLERVLRRPGAAAATADEADFEGAVLGGKKRRGQREAAGNGGGGEEIAACGVGGHTGSGEIGQVGGNSYCGPWAARVEGPHRT